MLTHDFAVKWKKSLQLCMQSTLYLGVKVTSGTMKANLSAASEDALEHLQLHITAHTCESHVSDSMLMPGLTSVSFVAVSSGHQTQAKFTDDLSPASPQDSKR